MAQSVYQTSIKLSRLAKSQRMNIANLARIFNIREILQDSCSKAYSSYSHVLTENEKDNKSELHQIECKEITIPVPYGNLAAKAWGRDNGYPILALHGWLDNSGTFDKLIPLLSRNLYIVAVDAPGHGFSSHKPPGCHYRDLDMIIDYKRVLDYLGWQKCSIIGHSMGGGHGLLFSGLFPKVVQKLIVIDVVRPISVENFTEEGINAISKNIEIETQMAAPSIYTIEEATTRLRKGLYNEVTEESAEILVRRATKLSESGNGYVFSRDLRCRTIERFSSISHETMIRFMSNVKCELLLIFSKSTHENYKTATPEMAEEYFEAYRSNCKIFNLHKVDGNHFVHINNPENVSSIINLFLAQRD